MKEYFLFNSLKNINHFKKYIFIHIPKTGGSTIERMFFNRIKNSEHLTIDSYKFYKDYFIFSFVRNPYLRIISIYTYFFNGGNGNSNEPKITCNLNDLFKNHNIKDLHFLKTQYSYLKNSLYINRVCKFENFELELDFLSNIFDIKYSKVKDRANNYKNLIIKPYFINQISELYDIDFKTYNYKKINIDKDILLFEFIELTKFNDEFIYYKRSPRLNIWYKEAYNEVKKFNLKQIDISKFPYYWYKKINNLNHNKIYDFVFIGSYKIDYKVEIFRKWIINFIKNNFNSKSYLQFTDKNTIKNYTIMGEYDYTLKNKGFVPKHSYFRGYFDVNYYNNICKSQFCLCPAGDSPWSMRFYEAIMCKSIPIVSSKIETYRSELESKIDYKYYLSNSSKFEYRQDWVEHNYKIFLENHTFEKYF